MKSLINYIKECDFATPLNTIGIGNIQDNIDFISLSINRKKKKQNKTKKTN